MPRRAGDINAFWDNVAVGAGGTSNVVELPRGIDHLALWITVSGATTVSLEAAHSGEVTSEGILPDTNAANWAQIVYTNVPVQHIFAGAGSICLMIPDFEPAYIRLKSTSAVTITAGWEAAGV